MKLQPIRTKSDYAAALREAERLWDAPEKSPEAEQLEVLALLEDYERRHFPIDSPDPIDFLLNVMEWRDSRARTWSRTSAPAHALPKC